MTKQQLNKYAINKLKQLAVEIAKKQDNAQVFEDELHYLRLRAEIYTALLEESNKPEF